MTKALPTYGTVSSPPRLEQMLSADEGGPLLLSSGDLGGGGENGNGTDATHGNGDAFSSFTHPPIYRTLSESVQTLAQAHFTLSQEALDDEIDRLHQLHPADAGKATIPSEVANMTKNLIGGGVLSLSGGMALYSNAPALACQWAAVYMALLGAVFGYFCLLIGRACDLSLSATYRECWERSVGRGHSGLLVAIMTTLDPLLGIFANASILAQSLQLLLQGSLDVYWNVVECLLVVTIVGLLPLCLLRNLDALAPFSALGMLAVLCALTCMTIRYLDGSYLPGGTFYEDIPEDMRPQFGTTSRPFSVHALPFICMVYTSFDMHYNSPRFYAELQDASTPRFAQVIGYSFGITALLYFSIAAVGFLTFGAAADSYILNNYAATDSLATVSRLAIGLCSMVSYPLNFMGVRDNFLDILGLTDEINTTAKLNVFTILLLSLLTLISCFVTDLGLINSVGGGTTVVFVCFIFPALMFREGVRKHPENADDVHGSKREVQWVMFLTVIGVILGIVGVGSSVVLA